MHQFIGFTISGLVTAGIYAIVACGLTLTYTTTGIFNWAHGALVAVGAFVYWQLTVGWGLPSVVGIVVCVGIVGPAVGWVLEVGIMHRLEGTSEATRMVVTLSLLLGLLAVIDWIWPPTTQRLVPPLFAGKVFTVLDQRVPYNDVVVMAAALLVAVALRVLLYRTRSGVEMRATVDDRALATLNGASARRTATRSWAAGSTLAVLAGVLIAPNGPLDATSLALLIVNAYAAAVIGRLRSLPMTFVGAIGLGLLDDYAQGYIGSRQSLAGDQYLVGLVNVLPVIVLFVALQFLPQVRLRGGRTLRVKEVSERPTWTGTVVLALVVVAGTIAVTPLLAPGDLNTSTKVWGIGLVALSLVPLVGYAGRLSVCPLSFAGIGAIVVAHLGRGGSPVAIVWAVLIAGFVGALVSLTALRLSGLYLALATAAFAVMLDNWIFQLPTFTAVLRIPFTHVTLYRHPINLFEGGTLNIRRFHLLGVDLSGDRAYFVFGSIVFALVTVLVVAIRRSDFGLRLIALKDSPVGYATLGLNQRLTTLVIFAISAGIAGLGGAVYGAAIREPSPDVFSFFSGLSILVSVVILGVSSVASALGAGIFVGGPVLANLFPSLSQLSAVLIGTAGIGLGHNPNGLVPTELRPRFTPVLQARIVLATGIGIVSLTYGLAVAGIIGNWPLVVVVAVVAVALPIAARLVLAPHRPRSERDGQADGLSAPPELLGFTSRLTEADIAELNKALDLPETAGRGVTHGT
jgi:branched-chain amino acid transport system permease protein